MELILDGRKLRPRDSDLVGEGGEARVYRLGAAEVLKVFHPPAGPDAARALALKGDKLSRFPAGLPAHVVAPGRLAHRGSGEVAGYVMRRVHPAEPLAVLTTRAGRHGRVSAGEVVATFRGLHHTLAALHRLAVAVGDLNPHNVLVSHGEAFLIDADSFHLPGAPCTVAHPRYLDPRLYGVDLSRAAPFSADTDWYAYFTLLFECLLSVHPFGGTHPAHATLLRRAQARHSVLRPDVRRPRAAAPPECLPDDLLHHAVAVFEHDVRGPFPASLLPTSWSTCRCGVEHARAACPACHALGPVMARPVLAVRGRCVARLTLETPGRILAAQVHGGIRSLRIEDGRYLREDGAPVGPPSFTPAAVALQGPVTWLASAKGQVEAFRGTTRLVRTSTVAGLTGPVLAASATACLRQEGSQLVDCATGQHLGSALEGHTRAWLGTTLGLSMYRAGGTTVASLLRVGRPGLLPLAGVGWTGRLLHADAVFDDAHALLSVEVERDGATSARRWLFSAAGKLLASSDGGPPGPAALLGGRVVIATDGGLCALRAHHGALTVAATFPDTAPFADATDTLFPGPDGSLWVVSPSSILTLSLSPAAPEVHHGPAAA